MSISNNPVASGSAFTLDMGKDSVTGNLVQKVALVEPSGGTFISPMQLNGGSVTALSSAAITNPTSVLTRPSSAVTASVTQTIASPSVFTWTGNPLVNGQTVVLGGAPAPGFTAGLTYYVVNVSGDTFQLAATLGGAGIAATGSSSGVTATLTYAANELIASSATSPVVPSFAIGTNAGGVIVPRVRIRTNATSGWGQPIGEFVERRAHLCKWRWRPIYGVRLRRVASKLLGVPNSVRRRGGRGRWRNQCKHNGD